MALLKFKRIAILVLMPLLATAAHAENSIYAETEETKGADSLAFCHSGKWSATCLTGLITYRCGQYSFPLAPYGCAVTAEAFVASLQMKRIDVAIDGTTYNLPVIFTRTLERLIQDGKTQEYLSSLRAFLVESATEKKNFDLWEWTFATENGDFEKTLENLAVLLQDTSAVAIQIQYLRGITKDHHFSRSTLKAIDDLAEITYQLNYDILKAGNWRARLRLYPMANNLENETTPLIYHFYPMAYLALKLQKAGYGERLSSFIPFLFNTEYLNQTLDPEAWPLHHPKPFKVDSEGKQWTMRDMYAGFAGALWGLQKTHSLSDVEEFESTYAKDPFGTMRSYFWSMPNR